jgi:hypothetical protein
MKKNLRHWAAAAVGAAAALAFTSCVYDPYYASGGYGNGYGNGYGSGYGGGYGGGNGYGYGDGYGYGGSNFSTSLFVSTGDPRWGYDPYCYSYYDYHRRCYYDPYLYGYYPIGYRPPIIIGAPHPHGWRHGHGYCPPPRNVRNVTVVNYRNREHAYRNSNYGWAKQVRMAPTSHNRVQNQNFNQNRYHKNTSGPPPHTGNYKPKDHNTGPYAQGVNPNVQAQHNNKYSTTYRRPPRDNSMPQMNTLPPPNQYQKKGHSSSQFTPQGGNRGGNLQNPPPNSHGRNPNPPKESGPSKHKQHKDLQGLGQG